MTKQQIIQQVDLSLGCVGQQLYRTFVIISGIEKLYSLSQEQQYKQTPEVKREASCLGSQVRACRDTPNAVAFIAEHINALYPWV